MTLNNSDYPRREIRVSPLPPTLEPTDQTYICVTCLDTAVVSFWHDGGVVGAISSELCVCQEESR